MKRILPLLLALAACQKQPTQGSAAALIEALPEDQLDLSTARIAGPVKSSQVSGNRLMVELQRPGTLTIRVRGACPLVAQVPAGAPLHARLVPWLRFTGETAEAGFDSEFSIVATPGCDEARSTSVEWDTKTDPESAAHLIDARVTDGGLRLTGRTGRLADLLGEKPPWGIVPLSPRTRGEVTLGASYRDGEGLVTRSLYVAAAARARGLPNVAPGTRLYLSSSSFHVVKAPEGATARVEPHGEVASFRPDRGGSWVLEDGEGRPLRLVARRYDETPLDCTRSDCHQDLDSSSRANPMTSVLQRGLDNHFSPMSAAGEHHGPNGDYPRCAGGCHAVGEPGIDDGGFFALASALGYGRAELAKVDWHGLPASLRRLGGVGCLSCHGPGAIPEVTARYGILRADVCATCHDAPPRYDHVAAFRTSRMARADADPRVSEDPSCARCHTTWGFLGAPQRRPPKEIGMVGIACAACHSVHPHATSSVSAGRCEEALTRKKDVPALLAGSVPATAERSQVCLDCHATAPEDGSPMASAALLWLGRGGFDPKTGEPLRGLAPESGASRGCVGCHNDGKTVPGAGHGFRATRREPHDRTLSTRARALFTRLVESPSVASGSTGSGPPHAQKLGLDRGTPRGRAAWNVALVLEDPAADAHNATYAKALLDSAEAILAPQLTGAKSR